MATGWNSKTRQPAKSRSALGQAKAGHGPAAGSQRAETGPAAKAGDEG
jgi:hypothetical protein